VRQGEIEWGKGAYRAKCRQELQHCNQRYAHVTAGVPDALLREAVHRLETDLSCLKTLIKVDLVQHTMLCNVLLTKTVDSITASIK
jgi:hypothetical protein